MYLDFVCNGSWFFVIIGDRFWCVDGFLFLFCVLKFRVFIGVILVYVCILIWVVFVIEVFVIVCEVIFLFRGRCMKGLFFWFCLWFKVLDNCIMIKFWIFFVLRICFWSNLVLLFEFFIIINGCIIFIWFCYFLDDLGIGYELFNFIWVFCIMYGYKYVKGFSLLRKSFNIFIVNCFYKY